MKFSDSFLDEIRARIPISEVVGSRVSFDRKKTNRAKGDFWACCPFHGEKTPSFHCEDRKGRYHCFGCGVSGDHFRFLTELDGLSFPEAVERLADQAGLPMPVMDRQEREREEQRKTLFDVMELATQFFEQQLQAPAGAKARAYLRDRGLAAPVQREFRVGYAPESRNALKEFLASKGALKDQIEACGLVVHGEGIAVSYDRFRDRIMFPIPDSRDRIIAFGGRALSPDVPAKYLNSPETELFHKSNVLYNFARARKNVHEAGVLIAAEGYMDVIALHAAGFKTAVAPLGTALTERQVELMWRLVPEPVLSFDGDGAGLKAAYRAIDLVLPGLQPGRSVRFAMLPEGQDPDDLIRAEGPEAFREVMNAALPLAQMIWNRETAQGIFETPEKRAELEARVRSVVALIRDESVRRHYEQDMRERLAGFFGSASRGSSGNQRFERAGGNQQRGGYSAASGGRAGMPSGRFGASPSLLNSSLMKKSGSARIPLREAALVVGIVNHPALLQRYFEEFCSMPVTSPGLGGMRQKVVDVLAMEADGGEGIGREVIHAALKADGQGEFFERAEDQLKRNRVWQSLAEAAFEDAADGWKQAYTLHMRSHTLNRELKAAEQALAQDDSAENLERLLQIQAEIARDEGVEALIDGFGLPSGRPSRAF
ncbi:MAG: DNA primase [Nitratireductor sp.]|nr:DNA primase [Nitratireductor sp.]MCC0022188.1 DNA primase [Nitratireductor sp.]